MGEKPSSKLEAIPTTSAEDESSQTFVIHDEDHTLGNSVRWMIAKNPEVEFCGYSVPHPSESKINLRIQTHGVPAADVFKQGLTDLKSLCEHVLDTFERTVEAYQSQNG